MMDQRIDLNDRTVRPVDFVLTSHNYHRLLIFHFSL
jgi:hypothetical protein